MWTSPQSVPLSSQFDTEWNEEAGNSYFSLQSWSGSRLMHKLGLTANDFRYRILWKTWDYQRHPDLLLIAISNCRDEIQADWEWIETNVMSVLPRLNESVIDEGHHTAIMSRLMDVLPHDDLHLERADVEQQLSAHFGKSVNKQEDLLLHTSAFSIGAKSKGVLCLTTSRLLFYSISNPDSNHQISISEIEKSAVSGNSLFGQTLTVTLKRQVSQFTNLKNTEAFDRALTEMKKATMRAILSGGSQVSSRSRSATGVSIAVDSMKLDPMKLFFRIPQDYPLVGIYTASGFSINSSNRQSKQNRLFFEGSIRCHFYSQWLGIGNLDLSVSIPLVSIQSISKSSNSVFIRSSINITIKLSSEAYIKISNVNRGVELYSALSHHFKQPRPPPQTEDFIAIDQEVPESMLNPLMPLGGPKSPISSRRNDELEIAWTDHLEKALLITDAGDQILVKSLEMRQMIWKHGIPERLRTKIWPLLIGFDWKGREYALAEAYQKEMAEAERNIDDRVADEIERDLPRSLPNNPVFADDRGLDALRRVLLLASHRNGLNGYTQAMNMIAAIFLLNLCEPIAAECLSRCTSEWFPDTYSKSLLGSAIDQQVFESFLMQFFPQLAKVMESGDLAVVTFGWFIGWFANLLNLECALYFFDVFLLEGPPAVHWFGLSIFKHVLSCEQEMDSEMIVLKVGELFKEMSAKSSIFRSVLDDAFNFFSPKLPLESVFAAKERHSQSVLKVLSDRTKIGDIRRLGKAAPLLSLDELTLTYDAAISSTLHEHQSVMSSISRSAFKIISRQLIPWTFIFGMAVSNQLYDHFCPQGQMTMEVLVRVIERTTKESPEEQALLYHKVCRLDGDSSQFARNNKHLFTRIIQLTSLY